MGAGGSARLAGSCSSSATGIIFRWRNREVRGRADLSQMPVLIRSGKGTASSNQNVSFILGRQHRRIMTKHASRMEIFSGLLKDLFCDATDCPLCCCGEQALDRARYSGTVKDPPICSTSILGGHLCLLLPPPLPPLPRRPWRPQGLRPHESHP